MKKNKTLLLFTESYPFQIAMENTFLDPEIASLHNKFKRIIIVPSKIDNTLLKKIYHNVNIELSYSVSYLRRYKKLLYGLKLLFSKLLFEEIKNKGVYFFNMERIVKLFITLSDIQCTYLYIKKFIKKNEINLSSTLFYSYWLNNQALGLAFFKSKRKDITLVARAHGYDLYEDRQKDMYLPFRSFLSKNIDKIFNISQHGKDYLTNQYKLDNDITDVYRLGVFENGSLTESSHDNIVRIVSCSNMIELKRLDLLLESLFELARKGITIHWTHLGDGPLMERLTNIATCVPANLNCFLKGYVSNQEVYNFYKLNPVDVFINVSSSEGIPVSIMEAQSFGIPVIATNVGGNSEIVNMENGYILSSNPSPNEIAEAIVEVLKDNKSRRIQSKLNWKMNYNAKVNFELFSQRLIKMI